jgi:hypothetical protein
VALHAQDVHRRPDGRRNRRHLRGLCAVQPRMRSNSRYGYRAREWDTHTGTMGVAIPRLRAGSCFPTVAGATPAGRADADHGGGDQLPSEGQYPPDREARRNVRHHPAVQVPGVGDG